MSQVRVFISYVQGKEDRPADGETANQLKEMINASFGPETCDLAPLVRKEVAPIPEHIAKMIEMAHYFIVIIPEEKNSWVNQEIGYAYSRARVGLLKIIVINRKPDRTDVEGFISKGSHHLAGDFLLGEDVVITFEKVIELIKKDRLFPLDVFGVSFQNDEYPSISYAHSNKSHAYDIYFNLGLENTSGMDIDNVTIDFILPYESQGQSDILAALAIGDYMTGGFHPLLRQALTNRQGRVDLEPTTMPLSTTSSSLPPHIEPLVDVDRSNSPYVHRKTFFLEKIPTMSRIEIPFKADIKFGNDEQECEVHLGVYLQIPRFGPRIYELLIRSKVENPRERIVINDRDKARITVN
ncbi:MAG: toll/interleukin-1 receptor domain-containing protein [Candidatus Thermoplasmatota archaeon]|nr:hypothetical protein [Euryarchaeota archaeon]MBU4144036.1 toll/interleukin-1 receptor domain-containing protein [Candidatus Thermoplasmatota archaeon]MBU4591850.1 toll/interleukin-1 receptor domain-containing protein [Candidatus Thermoplasmatota archaeon]